MHSLRATVVFSLVCIISFFPSLKPSVAPKKMWDKVLLISYYIHLFPVFHPIPN